MGNGVAARERSALADTLNRTGPAVPTLCAGWDAAHLAAHLVLRERRPDLQLRTLISHSSDRLTDALDDLAIRTPWPKLVTMVRHVPRLSPAQLTAVDERMNTIEFAVHHEDLRRTGSGWSVRELPADLVEGIWANLSTVTRLATRDLKVPVLLRRPDGRTISVGRSSGERVQVAGEPLELALFMLGRAAVARVELTGDDTAVAALRASRLAL
jgi:uncharacterized protein (TIGR03085 family)